jgi:hypothetical protein
MGGAVVSHRVNAAPDAIAGLENYDFMTGILERPRRGEACYTRTDNRDHGFVNDVESSTI